MYNLQLELSKSNNGCFKIVPLDTLGGVVPIRIPVLYEGIVFNLSYTLNVNDADKLHFNSFYLDILWFTFTTSVYPS